MQSPVNVAPGTYDAVNAAFTFTITWTPASGSTTTSDLILTVVGPDGSEVDSSDGGDPERPLTDSNRRPEGAARRLVAHVRSRLISSNCPK